MAPYDDSTLEIPLLNSGYKLHIGSGGIPLEILFPGEYCSLFVGRNFTNWSSKQGFNIKEQILANFTEFGNVTYIQQFNPLQQVIIGYSCLVRMRSKEEAARTIEIGFLKINDEVWEIKPAYNVWSEQKMTDNRLECYELEMQFRRLPVVGLCILKLCCRDLRAISVIEEFAAHIQPWSGFRTAEIMIEGDEEMIEERSQLFNPKKSSQRKEIEERDERIIISFKLKLIDVEPKMVEEDFLELFSALLQHLEVSVMDVVLLRHSTFENEPLADVEELRTKIANQVKSIFISHNLLQYPGFGDETDVRSTIDQVVPFNVQVQPAGQCGEYDAIVVFQNPTVFELVSQAVVSENRIMQLSNFCNEKTSVNVETRVKQGYAITEELLIAIAKDLIMIDKYLRTERIGRLVIKSAPSLLFVVAVEAKNLMLARESVLMLHNLISGVVFVGCRCCFCLPNTGSKTSLPICKLFTRSGKDFLASLQKKFQKNLVITCVPAKKELQVQGNHEVLSLVSREIEIFLEEWILPKKNWCISLLEADSIYPFTKSLKFKNLDLELFGFELGVPLELKDEYLEFFGTQKQRDQLLDLLKYLVKSERKYVGQDICCVVCCCYVREESFRLKNCGHQVCSSCLMQQVNYAMKSLKFPIKCAGCQTNVSVNDLRLIFLDSDEHCSHDPQKWNPLAKSALNWYINQHLDVFFHCPTPDCAGFFKRTNLSALVRCPFCKELRCSKCGNKSHGIVSCEQLKGLRKSVDSSVIKWLSGDVKSRRVCPNCQSPIEKVGGCHHMECQVCRMHFCWTCLFLGKTSNHVNEHSEKVHGTYEIETEFLIDEVMNQQYLPDSFLPNYIVETSTRWKKSTFYFPSFETLLLDDRLDSENWMKDVS